MKTFLVLMLLSLSVAHAGDKNTAYNAVCKPMTFKSDRDDCHERVKKYNYFNSLAVDICAKFDFDSNKIPCVDVIGDKDYDDYEINRCANQTFETQKFDCLKINGTPHVRCIDSLFK